MRDETEKRMEAREETSARVPYIGKPEKKRKCWRPKRKKEASSAASRYAVTLVDTFVPENPE